jgi:hypothetical protein
MTALTNGWARRPDQPNSRAMHYFSGGKSLCKRAWPQQGAVLHLNPAGIVCPDCLRATGRLRGLGLTK